MSKVTAVIVGAGLAGLSAAYSLAKEGLDVLVVERGDHPGAKSMTGGRMYFLPIKDLYPELWDQAPWERHVVKESLTLVSDQSSLAFEFRSQKYNNEPPHSFTVLASKFNSWFAQKAAEIGARIISKYKVDDLILEQGQVKGVVVGGAKIEADVVIAADGIMSQVAEKAGLRHKGEPKDFALGVKEVIEISAESIEARFGLSAGEGTARLFVGSVTKGMMGAGFLYTNQDSVSLGVVLGARDLANCQQRLTPYELLEEFKTRPEIQPLIRGGASVEYSAHLLSEKGLKGMSRLFGNGILVVGDAAGMTMNLGITVRGMDFAIASGALAARAVVMAKKQNDFSAKALSAYQDMLKGSFIGKDFNTFRKAPDVFANHRLFTEYPALACETMESLMFVGPSPKPKLSITALKQIRSGGTFSLLRDLLGFRRI